MDLLFGSGIYIVLALVFGREPSPTEFGWVMFFAIAPDLDWLPYLLLKKRKGLYSHWIIHFPLLYIPIGVALVWWASGEWFYMAAFVAASLAHFLHDAASTPGIQWFWPFSMIAHAIHDFRIVPVYPDERRMFYEKLREGAAERGFLEEIRMRLGKGRPEWFKRR